jgi:hypothetical protein
VRNGAALMHMQACSLLRWPSSVSRPFPTLSTCFCVVIRPKFWSSRLFSFVPLWRSITFLFWVSIATIFDVTWYHKTSSTPPVVRPLVGRRTTGLTSRFCGCFNRVLRLPLRHAVLVPSLEPRLLSSLHPAVSEFLCQGLVPSIGKLSLPPSLYDPRSEWSRRDGPTVQWP